MTNNPTPPNEVSFTPRQLEYLEKVFPEYIGFDTTTEATLRIQQGRRQVVAYVRSKTARI